MRSASSPSRMCARSSRLRAAVSVLARPARARSSAADAALDGLGQPDLVVLGEQRVLPDVGEVEADEIFLVALDALLGQGGLLLSVGVSSSDGRQPRLAGAGRLLRYRRGQPLLTCPEHGFSHGPRRVGRLAAAAHRCSRWDGARPMTVKARTLPDDVELTIVTMRFDAVDAERPAGRPRQVRRAHPRPRRVPQRRPVRLGDHAPGASWSSRSGSRPAAQRAHFDSATWSRWPRRAAACCRAARYRPARGHQRPRPALSRALSRRSGRGSPRSAALNVAGASCWVQCPMPGSSSRRR